MFKAKQLNKLVKAGIISDEQQKQILAYEDTAGGGFVMKALNLLGIFTIGIGVISLVAANWEYLGDNLKLIVMFALLLGVAGMAVSNKQKGQDNKAEKWLVALFMFVGAAIGLVIQVYQLNGENFALPFAFWWAATLPLLVVAKKKYVAWFWVPLFLAWFVLHHYEYVKELDFREVIEFFLVCFAIFAGVGMALCRCFPKISVGSVLQKDAFIVFYINLLSYMWFRLYFCGVILVVLAVAYHYAKLYRVERWNIKFIGLWVFSLYIWLGDKIGLFSTGIGLIISGVVLILLLKGVTKWSKLVKEEKKNA